MPTACVVKNALALFVRNDASKRTVVRTDAKDMKNEKVVESGARDMRSATGVLESNSECLGST
jgi:hypothetical protein